MRSAAPIVALAMLLLVSSAALAEFDAAPYKEITQTDLVKNPDANGGKKFRISDIFNFCGSDFCAQILKTKINTREYYCFNIGPVCTVRFYLKKNHPDAEALSTARKGDKVTVYGIFDFVGSNFRYLVADHVVVEKRP